MQAGNCAHARTSYDTYNIARFSYSPYILVRIYGYTTYVQERSSYTVKVLGMDGWMVILNWVVVRWHMAGDIVVYILECSAADFK